ncbi:endonuclease V [Candidatus Pacearchaeota archaeon]|nr:endonuclease V [Candidatus Pacearchaeota archaeon]
MHEKERIEEVIKKYNIDIKKLEEEQIKLAKLVSLKDSIDFNLAERIAGIENVFLGNKIISALVVMDSEGLAEQEYSEDKIRFPYIPGFRAYRELPNMIEAFNKLDEKPDIVFIRGNGILHPKGIGIASHFSIATGVPTIGIADSLHVGEVQGEDIIFNGKVMGKVLKTKEGANPIYISPGNMICLESALKLTKRLTKEPHKIPEPLRLAKRYSKEVISEIKTGF